MIPSPRKVKQLVEQQKLKQEEADRLSAQLAAVLGSLPATYGFGDDLEGFLDAVRRNFKASTAKGTASKKGTSAPRLDPEKKKGPGRVTDAIKVRLKELFEARKTTREITGLVGLSAATVNQQKEALGFVKRRKQGKDEAPETPPQEPPAPPEA